MEVKLLEHTKLSNSVIGLRNCCDSYMIYKALPEEHMFLYADCIK